MGQKVNPKVIRLGITQDWDSKWYAGKRQFSKLFHQDLAIEKAVKASIENEGVSKMEILRVKIFFCGNPIKKHWPNYRNPQILLWFEREYHYRNPKY